MQYIFILPKNFQKQTVKQLLEETWLLPRKQRHFLRTKKHFLLNNENVNWTSTVEAGDKVTLTFDAEDFGSLSVRSSKDSTAEILYQDEHLVIANKPEGLKTHGNQPDELAFQNDVAGAIGQPVYIVHRLDKETSGAVLFAKNQFVLPILGRLLENREIHREYLALVEGKFSEKKFTINQAIGHDRHDSRKRLISASGQRAITHVEVLETFKTCSLIRCRLDTGRTHQIRVHLSALWHPICGDALYHPKPNGRLMLHASTLSLLHPFSQKHISVLATSQTFESRYQQEKEDKNQRDRS
jgi:23S rRNA pseudouridine1911/1915/1917 synthase